MKRLSTLLTIVFIIFLVAYAGSPYYTAYQIGKAYDAKDGDKLVQYLDFDQLLPSIQTQLKAQFSTTLSHYPTIHRLGGDALIHTANQFIDDSVNKALTADNISQLIRTQGQANQATKELAAAWAIATNKINLTRLIQDLIVQKGNIEVVGKQHLQMMMNDMAKTQSTQENVQPSLSYCGINCFKIDHTVKGYPITAYLQRQGILTWKVVDITLPQ